MNCYLGSPDGSPVRKKSTMEDLFGEVFVTKVEPAKPVIIRAEMEVTQYREEPCLPLDSDPLLWWSQNEERFPLLAKLAKTVLCIQGTSVPSERVFSTAGDIVTAQRSALPPDNVDALIFLKKNMKL